MGQCPIASGLFEDRKLVAKYVIDREDDYIRMQYHHIRISCIGCIDDKVKPIPFPMKRVIGFIITQSGSHGNLLIIFDRVNLLSVGESQKIPCYELAQIVFS